MNGTRYIPNLNKMTYLELRDLLALYIYPQMDYAMASGNVDAEPITLRQQFYIRDLFKKLEKQWEKENGRSASTIDDAYAALMASVD